MGMTNKEKFKEVFGFEMDDSSDCGFFDCSDRDTCDGCVVQNAKDYWNSEYIPPQSGTWVTMSYDAYVELLSNTVKEQEPTTKNDLPHCQCTDAEIAKSFVEDVEAVKDQLPCGEQMDFPNTFDEFADYYGFKDTEEVYTNGNELIQVYRVKQWLEHISTTKNDLGVDCISRERLKQIVCNITAEYDTETIHIDRLIDEIDDLPSVTPQEPTSFQWCTDCKEYDQEKHCCHRWSKIIRDTVEEMKQEPKEITLDEVKEYCRKRCLTLVTNQLFHELTHHQEPILDKIRAEMMEEIISHSGTGEEVIQAYTDGLRKGLAFVDKYKAEVRDK